MSTTKAKRTREQVHQDGGHTAFVASCSLCVTEAEANLQAALGRSAEPPADDTGATEVLAEAVSDAAGGSEPASPDVRPKPVGRADDGRPQCTVPDCVLPEFVEGIGVCGGHYATHRGYATKVRG